MNLVLGLSINSVRLCDIVLSNDDCGLSYLCDLRCATSNGFVSKTLWLIVSSSKKDFNFSSYIGVDCDNWFDSSVLDVKCTVIGHGAMSVSLSEFLKF